MKLGLTVMRGVIGTLFIGHGTQKLFGWFGGHGPEGTGQFFESLGLRPGARHARAADVRQAVQKLSADCVAENVRSILTVVAAPVRKLRLVSSCCSFVTSMAAASLEAVSVALSAMLVQAAASAVINSARHFVLVGKMRLRAPLG